jgi:ACS family tartrate transporter-like MFS transporter
MAPAPSPTIRPDVTHATRLRVAWRLLPYLFVLYVVAFLDRVNVSYAAIGMTEELRLSAKQLGFGLGIFFVGYFLLEIPSTIIVERWSARKWMARIMIVWGFVASGTGLIHSAHAFYVSRFLLGIAEAGFFPGMIVYLSHWFTEKDRAKAVAMFMVAVPFSYVIGSPLSALILKVRWLNLEGWRWVFILEGAPAIFLGLVNIWFLEDWPKSACWLDAGEREQLQLAIERERTGKISRLPVLGYLRNRTVLSMAAVLFLNATGAYGFSLWLPTILKSITQSSAHIATLLSAAPYLVSVVSLLLIGWHSDKTGERHWHTAIPLLLSSLGLLVGAIFSTDIPWTVFGMCLVGTGVYSFLPSFWALPGRELSRTAAAVSAGLINSVGSLGGFLGPYLIGYLRMRTHSFAIALYVLSVLMCFAGLLVFTIRSRERTNLFVTDQSAFASQ